MGEIKKEIITRLKNIESKLDTILLRMEFEHVENTEKIIGMEAAMQITRLARPTIYSLASRRKIPHYKKGKFLYFKRKELEDWIGVGKRKTMEEIRSIRKA